MERTCRSNRLPVNKDSWDNRMLCCCLAVDSGCVCVCVFQESACGRIMPMRSSLQQWRQTMLAKWLAALAVAAAYGSQQAEDYAPGGYVCL